MRPCSTALNVRQFDPNVFGVLSEGQCEEWFYEEAASVPKERKGHVS
jgi:hypothetical protein